MRTSARIGIPAASVAFFLTASSPLAHAQFDVCQTTGLSSFSLHGALNATTTFDGASSCQTTPHPDIWWLYRPRTSGVLHLLVCGNSLTSPVNPVASVHAGCPGTAANELACNDDGNPGLLCYVPGGSELLVPVTAGQLYYIRASSSDGSTGPVVAQLVSGPDPTPPPNADWQSACAVSPGIIRSNNLNTQFATNPIWFSYTPASSGTAVADTCGLTGEDTTIQLQQGANPITWDNDGCAGSFQSRLEWQATAGVEYLIGHGYYTGVQPGFFSMRLSGPPAAQRECATAPTVTEGTRWLSFENAGSGGTSPCDGAFLRDFFYRYVAPTAGLLTVSTLGSDDGQFPDAGEDTLLSLHSGCPATAANTMGCNDTASASAGLDSGTLADAAVSRFVNAGQTVVIRVARVGTTLPNSNVPVRLNIAFAPLDISVCVGDGTGASCPCGNSGASGRGCANSQDASGAHLTATGGASLSNDTFDLHGAHMPPSGTALYVQGTAAAAGGAGIVFGDGLRCVAGTVLRLGVRTSVSGQSSFGLGDGTHVSAAGQIPPGGGTRVYQVWYRDAFPFCTSAPFNLSNGLSIPWGP